MLGCIFFFMYTLFVSTEIYHKKTFGISMRTLVASVFNILTNLTLIPLLGYTVAAYTTLASYLLLLLMHWKVGVRLKVNNYYNSKFIFYISVIMLLLTTLTLIVYRVTFLRYLLLGLLLILTPIFTWKNRKIFMN